MGDGAQDALDRAIRQELDDEGCDEQPPIKKKEAKPDFSLDRELWRKGWIDAL